MRDQVERTGLGCVFAQVHFEIVIARDALILPLPEAIERSSVERADDVRHVLAGVVDGACDSLRRGDRGDLEFRRRNHESLIDEDLRPDRVVDSHERQMIVVIHLP